MAMFWLALAKAGRCASSRLIMAAMPLARDRELVRSTVMARSISSVDLRWCSLVSGVSMAAYSLVSSLCCCTAPCPVPAYQAWAHTGCSS
jgi:hypothetical protein